MISVLAGVLSLGACSGGETDDDGMNGPSGGASGEVGGTPVSPPPSDESADGSAGSADTVARYGQIIISETLAEQGEPVSRVAARFVALGAEAMMSTAMLERTADTCDRVPDGASVPGYDDADEALPAGGDLPIDAGLITGELDAGQAIVLSSPDGTWSTLLPTTLGAARVYLQDSDGSRIDGRIPSGLLIDIPDDGSDGEDFPGFAAVALPDPQPGADSFVPVIGSPVDITTEFRWASNSATGSRMHLAIRDADGRLDCFAADDGLFTLDEAMPNGATLSGNATLAGVARESTRIERSGDATLVLTVATQ